ncbi:alpha/beta hydrolase [Hoeflea sp.]|uniref:alpha/beta hydrolase n=1 Tax=Hoeflea sp. TaxID=1940281 RepID=UPI0037483180
MTQRPAPYDRLLDAEIWAFVERSRALYPDDATGFDPAGQRRIYDDLCQAFDAGRPEGVTVADNEIRGPSGPIPLRRYMPLSAKPDAVVLYLHGGGFVVGSLDSHDSICAEFCQRTGLAVTAVDYRLAPEHVHPAQFEDALAAFNHVAGNGTRPVILCGDSAGGNLAAAVAWAKRDAKHRAIGQVLIYPALGNDVSSGTFVTHANAPMLSTADMVYYDEIRASGAPPTNDPSFTPLAAKDFHDMPPTVVLTAECDPLSGDGEPYCQRIRDAGGKAICIEGQGLVHGYLRARHSAKKARESFSAMVAAISALGSGDWPY